MWAVWEAVRVAGEDRFVAQGMEFTGGIGEEKEVEKGATGKSKNQSFVPIGIPEATAAR
jgi:hypothetical protein